jgi:hypothetical protein
MDIFPENFIFGHRDGKTKQQLLDMTLVQFNLFLDDHCFPKEIVAHLKQIRNDNAKKVSFMSNSYS